MPDTEVAPVVDMFAVSTLKPLEFSSVFEKLQANGGILTRNEQGVLSYKTRKADGSMSKGTQFSATLPAGFLPAGSSRFYTIDSAEQTTGWGEVSPFKGAQTAAE